MFKIFDGVATLPMILTGRAAKSTAKHSFRYWQVTEVPRENFEATDRVTASCCRRRLLERLDTGMDWSAVTGRVELRVTATVMHNGQELRLRVDPPIGDAPSANAQLIALVIRAR